MTGDWILGFNIDLSSYIRINGIYVAIYKKGPIFVFLLYLIAAIDRTRTRHRGVSLRTSERGSRVRVGCSPPLNFVASSRTLHLIWSTRRSALGSSEATAIIVTIIVTSVSMDVYGATTRKGTEATRLSRHLRRQVLKS